MRIDFLTPVLTLTVFLSASISCSPSTYSTGAYIPTENQAAMPQVPNTVQDIDDTIKDFQQQKLNFLNRQKTASRQAQRLLPIDFFQSRNYSLQAERYAALIEDIDQQITMLEQKKQQLLNKPIKQVPKDVT